MWLFTLCITDQRLKQCLQYTKDRVSYSWLC